jgi:cyclopropane fatty-acyl-phospholipid synthase-like methyltransferase
MQSRSEQDGLGCLQDTDLRILSVGISTAGRAEILMAQQNSNRHIVATTLDAHGAASTREQIAAAGLSDRITVKLEDISAEPVPYDADAFDFVYARLVLHYLSAQALEVALSNIQTILKKGGMLFVVVRSTESEEIQMKADVVIDENTQLTTYTNSEGVPATRYFHTQHSISSALERHGFVIERISQFDEDLSTSFDRNNGIWNPNNLIELIAYKS